MRQLFREHIGEIDLDDDENNVKKDDLNKESYLDREISFDDFSEVLFKWVAKLNHEQEFTTSLSAAKANNTSVEISPSINRRSSKRKQQLKHATKKLAEMR